MEISALHTSAIPMAFTSRSALSCKLSRMGKNKTTGSKMSLRCVRYATSFLSGAGSYDCDACEDAARFGCDRLLVRPESVENSRLAQRIHLVMSWRELRNEFCD